MKIVKRALNNLNFTLLPMFIFLTTNILGQHWQMVEMQSMPESVSNNAVTEAFTTDGKAYLYSFAGIDSTKTYAGIHLRSFKYDVEADDWQIIDALPDTLGKIAAAASFVKGKIYIIGGYHVFENFGEVSSDKVHIYDPNTDSYLPDGAPIPIPIDDQVQAVWRDSLIFVITGWSNNGNVADVQIYNPGENEWSVGNPVPSISNYMAFGGAGSIVNDTIYYFGGARTGSTFPITPFVRKGIINPDDPTDITWSQFTLDNSVTGYRMASTTVSDQLVWVGGSNVTYNFNGVAYNGSGGVPTANQSLLFDPVSLSWEIDNSNVLPMDLRGVGNISNTRKYIAGGMVDDQMVTAKTFRLDWVGDLLSSQNDLEMDQLRIYPNPAEDQLFVRVEQQNTSHFSQDDNVLLQIFDVNGLTLQERQLTERLNIVSLVAMQPGIYFVKVTNGHKSSLEKLVID